MGLLQYDLPGDGFELVRIGNDGAAQALSFLANGRYLLTAYAFNSLITALAQASDIISNANAAIKNSGIDYLTDVYYGDDSAQNGKETALIGAFGAPPADASVQRKQAWNAITEIIIRLGQQPEEDAASDVDEPTGATRMIELVGEAGIAAYPQRFISKRTTIRVNADLARNLTTVQRATAYFAVRLVAAEQGNTSTATTVVAEESTSWPTVAAISEIYVAERNKQNVGASLGMLALPVVTGLGRLATK